MQEKHPIVQIIEEELGGIIGPANGVILVASIIDDLGFKPPLRSDDEVARLADELILTIKDLIGKQGVDLLKSLVRDRMATEVPGAPDPWGWE